MNVTSDLQIASPQINVNIDRDRAQTFGVTPDQIQNALFTAYGTRQASTIYTPSNEYQVILEVEPQYQRNPDALSKLYVRSAKGSLVPLDSVVKLERSVGPLSVNHFGQLPAATISFNLAPGFALGDAAAKHRRSHPRPAHAAHARAALSGDRAGVPAIVQGTFDSADRGHSRDLHGAGDAL